jgi:hypothetical protein
MPATPQDVVEELTKLGLDAEPVVMADDDAPVGVSVWDPEQPTRVPVATVWEPRKGTDDGWSWGPHFQYGAYADDDAETIAMKVSKTLAQLQK